MYDAREKAMRTILKSLFGCVGIFFLAYCILNTAKHHRLSQQRAVFEIQRLTIHEPFRLIKEGRSSTAISDLTLLDKLADDADCVRNLASVTFSGVSFRDIDSAKLEELRNLVSIGFYDCKYVDKVISKCMGPQVHSISLDTTRLSPESLELLRKAKSIEVTLDGKNILTAWENARGASHDGIE